MLSHRRASETATAFTLVELIVVMVIMGIAAAMVIPYAVGTRDLQVISGSRILACDLQYAQNTAITSQRPVTVTFDTSTESYQLSDASGLLTHPITKGNYVVDFRLRSGFDKFDVTGASFAGNNTVTFDELGAPDNAGLITVQAGPYVYQVSVAPVTGNVTVVSLGS